MNRCILLSVIVSGLLGALPAHADRKNDPGATDTSIKIGQSMSYSGPASAYGQIGRSEAAYFKMINDQGGVNGRKIEFLSLDNAYSPPKTVETTRQLVEQDEVLLIFGTLGTPANLAIQRYLNGKKIPQLFIASGSSKWNDPKNFPWTMGLQPNYQNEARIFAQHILKTKPSAKIGVIYQNDDFGKDYVKGLKDELGDKVKLIVAEQTYEASDPTVDSQVVALKASGADVLLNFSLPKTAAQVIRKAADLGWRPDHYLANVSSSIAAVLVPAGPENSVGIMTAIYTKDPSDKAWDNDEGMRDWRQWMKKYLPEADPMDLNNIFGYTAAQALVYVLKQCGDEMTRENVMRHAASIKNLQLPLLLPGATINTSENNYAVIRSMQLGRFDGKSWVRFGDVLTAK